MDIPRIVHQTWKTENSPHSVEGYAESWRRYHPGWQFMFWTDGGLTTFVQNDFPEFFDLYRSYPQQIDRVNIARYLILKKMGGVFVDLDLECLRPLVPLLGEHRILIGLEPAAHAEHPAAVRRGVSRVAGTAFLASVPDDAFWDHVLSELPRFRHCSDALERTGSIFLTSAIQSYPCRGEIAIAKSPLLYPFDRASLWCGETFDLEYWERSTRESFAVHHWEGSWLDRGSKQTRAIARFQGRILKPDFTGKPPASASSRSLPLISCLMSTRNRPELATVAIQCFQRQTYPNKELLVTEHAPRDERLADYVRGLNDPRIHLHRIRDENVTLGETRNYTIERARGEYVAIWDDDDLSDPLRLEYQYVILRKAGAHASMLSRYIEWWPWENKLTISEERPWEVTILCEKSVIPNYPHLPRGGDTMMVRELLRSSRVALVDMPRLYLYNLHGGNVWGNDLATLHWKLASARFTGSSFVRVINELTKRLPIADYAQALSKASNLTPEWENKRETPQEAAIPV